MNTILYMSTSLDGFIAKKDGNSDWVSELDAQLFDAKVKEIGCILVGKTTYDQYQGDLYPISGVTNIVLTHQKVNDTENVCFASSPKEALAIAKDKGHSNVLLVGGGHTNGSFLKEGLINETIITVYPLILGEGIKLFENFGDQVNLEFIGSKELGEGLIQLRCKVG